jgi:prepilin-type N-terminal cleavage/methylation domain-containing protein
MDRTETRGMTLIEVTIVMALSTLVVMGMISFYISSQSTWMDGSTQALAQRDATLLVETVSDSVRVAALAEVQDFPDAEHQTLILRDRDLNEFCRFWWDEGDSLVHVGSGGPPGPPVVASRVTRFQLTAFPGLVEIRLVELRAGDGRLVRMTSAAALYNRETPSP